MSDNTSQIIEDIKWILFDDRSLGEAFKFVTWVGNGRSFIVADNDGQEYRITVEKENSIYGGCYERVSD